MERFYYSPENTFHHDFIPSCPLKQFFSNSTLKNIYLTLFGACVAMLYLYLLYGGIHTVG